MNSYARSLRQTEKAHGAVMEPVWRVLNDKSSKRSLTAQQNGSLKSALAGRQHPQAIVKSSGRSHHDKCIFCLHKIVEGENPYRGTEARTARVNVEASDEQLATAPTGDLNHRLWAGDCLGLLRKENAHVDDLQVIRHCNVKGHPPWEQALMVRPPLPKEAVAYRNVPVACQAKGLPSGW